MEMQTMPSEKPGIEMQGVLLSVSGIIETDPDARCTILVAPTSVTLFLYRFALQFSFIRN